MKKIHDKFVETVSVIVDKKTSNFMKNRMFKKALFNYLDTIKNIDYPATSSDRSLIIFNIQIDFIEKLSIFKNMMFNQLKQYKCKVLEIKRKMQPSNLLWQQQFKKTRCRDPSQNDEIINDENMEGGTRKQRRSRHRRKTQRRNRR